MAREHKSARAENTVSRGKHAEHPYVLASQPTVVDPSRAPAGKHVLWTYTHVPRGSSVDQAETVIRQIERYAPDFRDTILAVSSRTAVQVEDENPNYVGGDIAAGSVSMRQLLARPVLSSDPWHTPLHGVYLCSASTPPGPGVHGLCGWQAALSALRNEYGIRQAPDLAENKDLREGDLMAVNYRVMNCEPRHVFDVLANGWVYPSWVVGASRMRDVDEGWPRPGTRSTIRSASGRCS